ncbi:Hypothetical protein SRAE_1000102600 [Strongyloides ratti]|uniref:Uncharacterized protein n=1 Tax=Strongyloides ratti TaxID=34506 RepID=A0A090KZB7_STRRB|nr:Hypothetical protein SRAE_1000102600 [Strongyloides ratti]CEF62756.1 Hypothetical protein SRAE_1000102600 [Strongyloides ratti]
MLNNWKGKFKLRYCNEIVIRFKPTTNEFSFLTISYNGDNFLAHGCPTETFLGYNDDIKYITDKYVLEKGIKHSMQDQSYILIPIFPRKPNDTFFVCGTLKQPSQDDLHFGFKLKDDAYFFYYYLKEKSLDVLDPFCKNNDNMYHTFNYLHYNYKFEKIKMTEINASDELYYGSKTVGYNFKDFTDSNYDKKVDIIPLILITKLLMTEIFLLNVVLI